ncbi:hypothetical protein GGS20DRAFT_584778 [Poronia punctata]|nr:hypothetical protein GGS20DRAFT_584778 [Poronia punctata]
MLMPSALSSCDISRPPVTRLQSSLMASPPASPPPSAQTTIGTIVNSCRALQSMLTIPPPTSERPKTLPTPPMPHAPLPPPLKMRLRSRTPGNNGNQERLKIRRRQNPPRGANKRRRAIGDDMGRDNYVDSDPDISDSDIDTDNEASINMRQSTPTPTTPKRARIAPESIPLGLGRSDFHKLHEPSEEEKKKEGTELDLEEDGELWSIEDDRVLVELVIEKLRLSKTEWQECARRVGKGEHGVERRWKSLLRMGDVGVRSRLRRGKLHGTWG